MLRADLLEIGGGRAKEAAADIISGFLLYFSQITNYKSSKRNHTVDGGNGDK